MSKSKASLSQPKSSGKTFNVGGAVAPDRHVFILSPVVADLLLSLGAGNHCNLRAGRQGGKTTAMYYVRDELNRAGHFCLNVEFTPIFISATSLADGVYRLLTEMGIGYQNCVPEAKFVKPEPGLKAGEAMAQFLCAVASSLPKDKRLYLMWDELDILMRYTAEEVAEFLLTVRAFAQNRDQNNKKIVFLLVSVLTPNDMLREHPTGGASANFYSDFTLRYFENSPVIRGQLTSEGFPNLNNKDLDSILQRALVLTGGQPYLINVIGQALQAALAKRAPLYAAYEDIADNLMHAVHSNAQTHFDTIKFQIFALKARTFELIGLYKKIWLEESIDNTSANWACATLESIGLIRVSSQGFYEVASPLYKKRLNDKWAADLVVIFETQNQGKFLTGDTNKREFNKKIALILCGGTVGMTTSDGKSGFQGAQNILDLFVKNELSRVAHVTTHSMFQLDGMNVNPKHWQEIAKKLLEIWNSYDGFIIAHGTDTLAYSASAVSFMLGRVDKPVVFTGAQTTLNVLQGDARQNLIRAVCVAASDRSPLETQIFFNDVGLRAVRAEKADDRLFQGFRSPGWPPLVRVTEHLLANERAWMPRLETQAAGFNPYISTEVLCIDLRPGLRPEHFRTLVDASIANNGESRPIEGILISTPGVGNIPSLPPYNFQPFIEYVIETHGIPVLISSLVPINPYVQQQYELASVPTQYGAIHAGNMTAAAAYTKFAWVIGCVDANGVWERGTRNRVTEIAKRMKKNYVGEEGEFADQNH
jgi:L-asparaginase